MRPNFAFNFASSADPTRFAFNIAFKRVSAETKDPEFYCLQESTKSSSQLTTSVPHSNSSLQAFEKPTSLVPTPTRGEPVQSRRPSALPRRQSSSTTRASNKSRARSSKVRGLRSVSAILRRKAGATDRRKCNRQQYKTFKSLFLTYCTRQKPQAREAWKRHRRQKQKWKSMKPTERKQLFMQYKAGTRMQTSRWKMAYSIKMKVATLNVRGLIGDNAITKALTIVQIMKKEKYDIMLLRKRM